MNLNASDAGEERASTGAAEGVPRDGIGLRERVSEVGLPLADGQAGVPGSAERRAESRSATSSVSTTSMSLQSRVWRMLACCSSQASD